MANQIYQRRGTLKCITFGVAAEYSPVAANTIEDGTVLDVAMDINGAGGIANNEARASAKADLGDGSDIWSPEFIVLTCMEYFSPPTGGSIDFYWAASSNATALNGNPGFVTGSDADYTGTPATLAEVLPQLEYIGSLIPTLDTEFQLGVVGILRPTLRYGCLVVHNNGTGVAIAATDAVETATVFIPTIPELQ